jgi:hypothetical protein
MDLTQSVPRSPWAALDGYTWLPRMIDKARAQLAGTPGDYHYGDVAPMDRYFFHATGIGADELLTVIAENASDAAILAWVQARAPLSQAEKDAYQAKWQQHAPTNAEGAARLAARIAAAAPDRPDVVTWLDLMVVEENIERP